MIDNCFECHTHIFHLDFVVEQGQKRSLIRSKRGGSQTFGEREVINGFLRYGFCEKITI